MSVSQPVSPARVAIVTGAAGDLSSCIAKRLAKDGLDIVLTDLPAREAELAAIAAEIGATGRRAVAIAADVTVEAEVQNMVKTAADVMGGVDVIVANAGIFKGIPLDQMDAETWDNIFAVNVRGMMFCYKYAARKMIEQGRGGKLIGGSSVAGLTGAPLCTAYCASKFAVRGLTQAAAIEYAKNNITVNAFAPGFIGGTRMYNQLEAEAEHIMGIPTGGFTRHALTNTIKLGRLGRAEDVAGLVSFLASRDSDYVTGQTYSCDGGMHIA